MVKIRLSLVGKRNAPAYRIVVCDERVARNGKNIEIIGHYNPSVNPPTFSYKKDRYEYWLSVGAQPTDAVKKLIAGKYEFKKYEPKEKGKEEEKDEKIEIREKEAKQVVEKQQ